MPIREYECTSSGQTIENIEMSGDKPLTECPDCGAPVFRRPAAPAFVLKGYGFTPKFHAPGRKDPHDTLEETENGQLRDKTGAGHDAP